MKIAKRIIAILCAVSMLVCLSSCSVIDNLIESQMADIIPVFDGIKAKELNIGVLYAYDLEHDEDIPEDVTGQRSGFGEMCSTFGVGSTSTHDNLDIDNENNVENAISSYVTSSACNVIIATDPGYADKMYELSKEYTNTLFAVYGDDIKYENTDNFFSYSIDTSLAYFAAGAASAKAIKSDITFDSNVYTDKENFVKGVNSINKNAKVVDGTFEEDAEYIKVVKNWDVFFIKLFDGIINGNLKSVVNMDTSIKTGICSVIVPNEYDTPEIRALIKSDSDIHNK